MQSDHILPLAAVLFSPSALCHLAIPTTAICTPLSQSGADYRKTRADCGPHRAAWGQMRHDSQISVNPGVKIALPKMRREV